MKIKEHIELSKLLDFGFEEKVEYHDDWEFENKYSYELGHSRRGQFYFLTVDKETRTIKVFATKPDGDGTDIELGGILLDLFKAGMIEY